MRPGRFVQPPELRRPGLRLGALAWERPPANYMRPLDLRSNGLTLLDVLTTARLLYPGVVQAVKTVRRSAGRVNAQLSPSTYVRNVFQQGRRTDLSVASARGSPSVESEVKIIDVKAGDQERAGAQSARNL
jgi:hypothetical protein